MTPTRTAHMAGAAPGAWSPLHSQNVKPHAAVADVVHRGGRLQLLQFQVFLKTTWSWSVYSDMQWAICSSKQYFNLSFLSLNSFTVDINIKRNLNYFYCVKFSNDYLLLQLHTLLSGQIFWLYLSLLIWKNLLLAHRLSNCYEISSMMLTTPAVAVLCKRRVRHSFKRGIYKGQRLDTQIKHNTIFRHTLASSRLCLYSLSLTSPEQQYLQRIPSRQWAVTSTSRRHVGPPWPSWALLSHLLKNDRSLSN